jgi:hypothetical protein
MKIPRKEMLGKKRERFSARDADKSDKGQGQKLTVKHCKRLKRNAVPRRGNILQNEVRNSDCKGGDERKTFLYENSPAPKKIYERRQR